MASLSVDANYEVAVYTSVRFALSHVPASVWAVVCGIGSVLCLTQAWLLRQYATALEELPILSAREAAHQVWSAWKTRCTVMITNMQIIFHTPIEQQIMTALKCTTGDRGTCMC